MNEATRPTGGAFRVGDFVVEPRSGELCGKGGRLILPAQPLHVLLALAERPGALVTRDELRARLWPADTYVDFEHGLNAVVKRLRDALGDSADVPRYIETVPRRGYRLVADVAPAESAAVSTETPAPAASPSVDAPSAPHLELPPSHAPQASARRTRWLLTTVLGALAVAALAYVVGWRRAEPAVSGVTAVAPSTRFTFGPGLQTDATWSPDGRRITFVADRDGNFDLFIQAIDGGEPVQVTRTAANETQPAWSPDGRRLVFRSSEDGGGLFTVSVDGGPIRRLTTTGFRPLWMPDGRHIVFSNARLQNLFMVPAEGGEPPREILEGQLLGGAWSSFTVHPDGRIGVYGIHPTERLAFYVSDRALGGLRSASAGTTLPAIGHAVPGRAYWNRKGDAVFVEAHVDGVDAIWRVPVDPDTQAWRHPVRLTTGPAGAVQSAISPDGRTLAFTSAEASTRVWVFPFDTERGGPLGEGRAVTDEDASIAGLTVIADGSAVFYRESRPGRPRSSGVRTDLMTGETATLVDDVVTTPVPSPRGSGTSYALLRPLADAPADEFEFALAWREAHGRERVIASWSANPILPSDVRRDDRFVLATVLKRAFTGPGRLVEWPVGPSAATEPSRVLLDSSGKQFWQGRYSPDGRWVSFVVVSLDGDSSLQMGIAPATEKSASWTRVAGDHRWPDKPRWSPDGRTLYFLSLAPSGLLDLWSVRVDPSRGVPIGSAVRITRFDSPRWHIDPELSSNDIGVAPGRLVLPMRTVRGSIWLLSNAGT